MGPRIILAVLALAVSGCSWTRFDDVSENAPVVLFNKPDKMSSGFGVSLASLTLEDRGTRVLVGGSAGLTSPAALFDLGTGVSPTIDSIDNGFCDDPSIPCYLGTRPAGLARAEAGDEEPGTSCFVLGAGKTEDTDQYGLYGRCFGGLEYTLPVPRDVRSDVIEDELVAQRDTARATIRLASDRDTEAALVAGAEIQRYAWYYRPMSDRPIQLVPPGGPEESYGASLAILRLDADGSQGTGSRLVLVGAPEAGHVWIFGGDDAEGSPVGCLGGSSGFGRAIATGKVDRDGVDDLIVADDASVTVISGAALTGLSLNDAIECSLSALPPGAILASFGCGSRDAIAGCPGDFGAAVDVGDLDGDGDGEVLVGAPGVSVRGTASAGAVLVYDVDGESPEELSDILYISSREGDDRLGSSLLAAPIETRDVVVAGVPGSARTAVFYCSKFVQDGGEGRCQ